MSNEKLTFKLNNIVIEIEAFHFTETYAGLLMGKPTKEVNEIILAQLDYPDNWGNRNAKYNNSVKMFKKPNLLKPYFYSVWLSSSTTINDPEGEYYGSNVVASWFDDAIGNTRLIDFVKDGLKSFDWLSHAQNYNP